MEKLTLKCKPTFNYQSIEYEFEINNEYDMDKCLKTYAFLVKELMKIAPEQEEKGRRKPAEPKEELATDKQKEILARYGIPYDKTTTKKQAYELIKSNKEKDEDYSW